MRRLISGIGTKKSRRLVGRSDWIDMEFVEQERRPESAMKLGIQSHLVSLSLSNTVSLLAKLGIERSRKVVYEWVQKAALQPTDS